MRSDQLGDLADDINKMADEAQRMPNAKRQQLLGIIHELRSPLLHLKLALELADNPDSGQGLRHDIEEMQKFAVTLQPIERFNYRLSTLRFSRVSA